MKTIDTLVPDIYALFDEDTHHEPSEENLQRLGEAVIQVVRNSVSERDRGRNPLRFSNLGKPDRQLWYLANRPDLAEKMPAKTYFKFLYGHVIEQLLMFFSREAGHEVSDEQLTLNVDGIYGHIDGVIDRVTVDAKSASPYAYQKFIDGRIFEDDPFGYIGQLSGYAGVVTPATGGAFLVADKVHGDIGLVPLTPEKVGEFDTVARIAHLKDVIASPEKPERCYPPVPEGKSGNMRLCTNCSYCGWKEDCWDDSNGGKGLRTFLYAKGPVFFTEIVKEPLCREVLKGEVIEPAPDVAVA